jgi:hypothetical protein
METNINLFAHSKKLFYAIMESQYETNRRSFLDFPSKTKWLDKEWSTFKNNNPEILGLKYDKENQDWVHEYEGGLVRTILK